MTYIKKLRQLAQDIIERRKREGWQPQEAPPREKRQGYQLPPGWHVVVNPMPAKLNPKLVAGGVAEARDNRGPIEGDRAMTTGEKALLRAFLSDQGRDYGDEERGRV